MLIALIVTIAAIRVKRADLAGGHTPPASPAGDEASAGALEEQRNEKSRDVPAGQAVVGGTGAGGSQPPAQRRNP
jgi:hypothetical protein